MPAAEPKHGKVVSLINMKGGVGKTTLAVGLSWELAKSYDMLLVDIDPQFNATQWLVTASAYLDWHKDKNKRTVFDVFQPDPIGSGGIGGFRKTTRRTPPSLTNAVMNISHGSTDMDLLPSTLELMTLDAAPRGVENRLKVFLDVARKKYDFIFIDCPPTASLFSYSAYLASDYYIVPVKPDPLSVLGLPLLERALKDYESRSGHVASQLGLVLTLVRGTEAMEETVQQLREQYGDAVFEQSLKQATGIAEAVDKGVPLQRYKKARRAIGQELEDLAAEFIERIDNDNS
jgi:chromosome partitioning protein